MTSLVSHEPPPEAVVLRRRPQASPTVIARRRARRRVLQYSLAAGIPFCLALLWQIASMSGALDQHIYPPPSTVFSATVELWSSGRLMTATLDTLQIVLIGFAIGVLAGFVMGVVTGVSVLARASLEPFMMALYVVPKLALLPVFLTIFGFGNVPKVVLVVVTVFFFVWIDVMESMWQIPEGYIESARALQMTRTQLFWHVRLPAILPAFFVSLRISTGVAVLVTIAAEFIVGGEGLGYLIFSSNQYFQLDRVYSGIVIVALLGVAIAWVISLIGRRLTPWLKVRKA